MNDINTKLWYSIHNNFKNKAWDTIHSTISGKISNKVSDKTHNDILYSINGEMRRNLVLNIIMKNINSYE